MKSWNREGVGVPIRWAAAATTAGVVALLAVSAQAATPSLTLTATDAGVGDEIHATAQLSESTNATGEISFEVFGPNDPACSAAALEPAPAPVGVSGDGSYDSGDFTPLTAGTYHWSARYPGDDENPATTSVCSAFSVVAKASPGLTAEASDATAGGAINDEATLSGGFSPGGQLVFRAYGPDDASCADAPAYEQAIAVAGNGSYAPAGFSPGPGSYRWTVEYGGDANNTSATSPCGAANQTSTVDKASPILSGTATSVLSPGLPISDDVTLAGGSAPSGELIFRIYGPGDETCATAPKYEEAVTVSGNGPYASPAPDFSPTSPGRYLWTVEYTGDEDNAAVSLGCDAPNQASAVGTLSVSLTTVATGATVGDPVTATATIGNGAIPAGQLTFKAFSPGDASCTGAAAFSSTVPVSGNGPFQSAAFAPARVGTYRWTVAYSGDANHAPAAVECGKATSSVVPARPLIAGQVKQRLAVGTAFRDWVTLQGGHLPGGTITFRIYGPVASGCARPISVNTVAINGNATYKSDPFVAKRPGRYSFVASYSGDAANQAASEPCDAPGQTALVTKREPKVKPRARLIGAARISIRARLSGGASPSGVINFRLYGPGHKACKGRPAFSGATTVKANGSYSLAEYFATRRGVYRLEVGYSGDQRNRRFKSRCSGAQAIRVG